MKLSASALTAAVLTLSACGTMFNGSSEKVFFDSNVKNVSIYDNGALLCSTPCEADITHRSSTVYLTAKKKTAMKPLLFVFSRKQAAGFG